MLKLALRHNAAALILAHNHPGCNLEPSLADETLTVRFKEALGLVDVRVLHIIVAEARALPFAERRLM